MLVHYGVGLQGRIDTPIGGDTGFLTSMPDLTQKQQRIRSSIQHQPTSAGATQAFGVRSLNSVGEPSCWLRQEGLLAEAQVPTLRATTPRTKLEGTIVELPVVGSIPAGPPQLREQDAEGCVTVDVASLGYQATRNTFALRVHGDSMIGKHILDGDIVVLEHGPEPRHGQIVAVLVDGHSTLKTYLVKGGQPHLPVDS